MYEVQLGNAIRLDEAHLERERLLLGSSLRNELDGQILSAREIDEGIQSVVHDCEERVYHSSPSHAASVAASSVQRDPARYDSSVSLPMLCAGEAQATAAHSLAERASAAQRREDLGREITNLTDASAGVEGLYEVLEELDPAATSIHA